MQGKLWRSVLELFRRPVLATDSTFRLLLFLCAALVFALENATYPSKIDEVTTFEPSMTEITTHNGWHYAMFSHYHGALVYRAKDGPAFTSYADEITDDRYREMLANEIIWIIPRRGLEGLLYVVVAAHFIFVVPWGWCRLPKHRFHLLSRLLFSSLAAVIGWTLILSPFLIWGYGGSMYSNYEGPMGGSIWSRWSFSLTTLNGETYSYRPLLERLCLIPLKLFVERWQIENVIPFRNGGESLLFMGALLYGGIGLLFGTGAVIWSVLRRATSDDGVRFVPPLLFIIALWLTLFGSDILWIIMLSIDLENIVSGAWGRLSEDMINIVWATFHLLTAFSLLALRRDSIILFATTWTFLGATTFESYLQYGRQLHSVNAELFLILIYLFCFLLLIRFLQRGILR